MILEKISDIVIHGRSPNIDPSRKPIKGPFDLSNDLRIDHLPKELFDRVFEACIPSGYRYDPVCQFGQLYSFVRDNPPNPNNLKWDSDQRLQLCLALSRVVHPTGVSFKYAVRIITDRDDNLSKIIPGPVTGPGSHAFVIDPKLNCLTDSDADELKKLLKAWEDKPLNDPIARAMWYLEYAFRSYEIDLRWPLIATGIEVLIHTDRRHSTRQFVERIKRLSIAVGSGTLQTDEAEDMYEFRSSLSHGQGLGGVTERKKMLYEKMEDILRRTIKKSILEQHFDDFLSNPDNIRRCWPV